VRWQARALGFFPYNYGHVWEVKVNSDGSSTTTKHLSMGRLAIELAYVMPDRKTAYITDDGTNVVFTKFVADRVGPTRTEGPRKRRHEPLRFSLPDLPEKDHTCDCRDQRWRVCC
jgi:secreted PhoX family phosphatase